MIAEKLRRYYPHWQYKYQNHVHCPHAVDTLEAALWHMLRCYPRIYEWRSIWEFLRD